MGPAPIRRVTIIIDKLAGVFAKAGLIAAGLILFSMMWLIVVDVTGRYLFDSPTQVAHELSGYALVAIAFVGAATTQRARRHIEITAIIRRLPQRPRQLLRGLTLILAVGYFTWLTWATTLPVIQNLQFGAVSVTPLRTPLWIPSLLIPVGLSILVIQLIVDTVRQFIADNTDDADEATVMYSGTARAWAAREPEGHGSGADG